MNLLMATENITVWVNDTVTAAGRRAFDVETDHIIVSGPSIERCTFTT